MRGVTARVIWATGLGLTVAACSQSATPPVAATRSESPLDVMERVALRVQACWYDRKRPALRGTRLSPELSSHSGRPRILIVPRNQPQGLPRIVAEARKVAGRTRFDAFGPALTPTLSTDLDRWAAGGTACTA